MGSTNNSRNMDNYRNNTFLKQQEQINKTTKQNRKFTAMDYKFGKVIGEGSYSTVYLAKEVESGKEFASE